MCLLLQERDQGLRVCRWQWLRLSDETGWRGWCSGWAMGAPESPDEGHPDCVPPVSQTRVASHCHYLFLLEPWNVLISFHRPPRRQRM